MSVRPRSSPPGTSFPRSTGLLTCVIPAFQPVQLNWNVKARREPQVWIFAGTAIVMLIAMGIFIWSVVQSKREGSRITASESPRTGGGMAAGGYEVLARVYPPAYRVMGGAKSPRPAGFKTAIERYSE